MDFSLEREWLLAMIDFTGIKCPVCGVPFKEDDDIVVCPQCGAPYHRDCYAQKGQCVFPELHQAGKEWAPPPPPKPPVSAEVKDRECPACGCLNAHSAMFCNRCGAALTEGSQPGQQAQPHTQPPPYTPYGASSRGPYPGQAPYSSRGQYPGAMPFAFDPMGGVNPADTLDSGVSYGDASKLVKQNTAYYMPVFRYMKQTGRNKFSFSAFLFSGAWMLYRKQYKQGAVITGLMLVIYLLYLSSSIFVATPALMSLMEQAGMDVTRGFAPTSEQMIVISQLLTENPALYLKICLPMLCLLLLLALMLFTGIRGNKMYMNHCIRTVRQVKAANLADYPNMTLDAKGGVNTSVAVCMFVCYFLLVNVVPLLL
ncbi:RING finger protein [Acutalibacter sp.]|jgi:hypothetical protein|uniref:RING finger protein n=1 Tax=Acutalibacter sp. TaxID=1918636 RepID=UPI0021720C36|nr:DUF2628 domain-containing protein [Acutalibacter sp.]